jgi:hypothetical protein
MTRSDTMGTAGFREETHLLESTSESASSFGAVLLMLTVCPEANGAVPEGHDHELPLERIA